MFAALRLFIFVPVNTNKMCFFGIFAILIGSDAAHVLSRTQTSGLERRKMNVILAAAEYDFSDFSYPDSIKT